MISHFASKRGAACAKPDAAWPAACTFLLGTGVPGYGTMVYLWELRPKFSMNRLFDEAKAAARAGNFAAAAELCRRAIASGADADFGARLLASCLYDLGVTLWMDGRGAEAEREFRAAIEADPRHIDALNNLGALLQLSRQHDEALALYRRALEVQPGNVRGLENLARLLQLLDRFDEASATLAQLARANPANGAAYLIRQAVLIHKISPDA